MHSKPLSCIITRLYWKRVIAQYRGWTVVFQICTMYTAFLDKEIFHQSPGRRSRWHWLHPLKCLCCSWCCAADLVLLCTKLRSCSSRQQSDTTDKYADQPKQKLNLELAVMVWRTFSSVILSFYIKTFLGNDGENCFSYRVHRVQPQYCAMTLFQ